MSKHNELRYGETRDVCYWLDLTECDEMELRAALLNAFNRIETLEIAIRKLTEKKDS